MATATRFIWTVAGKLRALQSGNLNFYLGLMRHCWWRFWR
jgi:hypothetical protein